MIAIKVIGVWYRIARIALIKIQFKHPCKSCLVAPTCENKNCWLVASYNKWGLVPFVLEFVGICFYVVLIPIATALASEENHHGGFWDDGI